MPAGGGGPNTQDEKRAEILKQANQHSRKFSENSVTLGSRKHSLLLNKLKTF